MESTKNHSAETTSNRAIGRRTIIKGAAWSVPIIAVATASSATAASGALALVFQGGPFAADACTALTGVKVLASTGGLPTPNTTVTVTLPAGLYFANSATTYTAVTAADGTITLPTITVGAGIGALSQILTATTPGAPSATAPISTIAVTTRAFQGVATTPGLGTVNEYPSVPDNATPLGIGYYQASNGDIYSGNTRIITGAQLGAVKMPSGNGTTHSITYFNSNGVASMSSSNTTGIGSVSTFPSVPAGSTPLGMGYFQAPNGDIYSGNTRIITGAKQGAAKTPSANGTTHSITYFNSNGVASQSVSSTTGIGTVSTYPSVPAESTPLGIGYFQAPNGDIYSGNTLIITGAKQGAVKSTSANGTIHSITYFDSNGVAAQSVSSSPGVGTISTYPSVPAGSTPLGIGYFQAPNGDIYAGNDKIVDNAVQGAIKMPSANGVTHSLTYLTASC